jgi:hypothetical protein
VEPAEASGHEAGQVSTFLILGLSRVNIGRDDGTELSEPGVDMFQGRWNFANNSDGGVIGELGGSGWEVVVDPLQWATHDGTNPGIFNVTAAGASGSVALANGTGSPGDQIVFRPVPEPAAFGLVALALPLLLWVRRRRSCQY